MAVRYVKNSRLQFGNLVDIGGIEFWDLLVLPPVPESESDIEYTVKGGDRIDLIANKFYGDPILWFVIAVANDMELLPVHLNLGDTIRIPDPRGLAAYFATVEVR